MSHTYRYNEDDLLPLSALQHWLYCPRQCGLIHIENLWADNRYTAEGNVMHEQAHSGTTEKRPGVRIKRSLPVRSLALGLSGQCDIVEFHSNSRILPVEYKRGRPKKHRADEVQLCAQAMCLEAMLGKPEGFITEGCLYYGKTHRRTPIQLDQQLRKLVSDLSLAIHTAYQHAKTPHADYEPARCNACSLIDLCQPQALRHRRGVASWFDSQIQKDLSSS